MGEAICKHDDSLPGCHHCDDADTFELAYDIDYESRRSEGAAIPHQLWQAPRRRGNMEEGSCGHTLFIFDWDDTLFCTSAINAQSWSPEQLEKLEWLSDAVLNLAMMLGETWIVTNGIESWVEHSAGQYLPGLLPTLGSVKIFSARSRYEETYPGDPFIWKRKMFQDLLGQDRLQEEVFVDTGSDDPLNLVVLGDGEAEMEAARSSRSFLHPSSLIKTVKFRACPTLPELLGQLHQVLQELEQIVDGRSSARHGLVQHAPSGWQCGDCHLRTCAEHVYELDDDGEDPGTRGGYALAASLGLLGMPAVDAKIEMGPHRY